MSAMYGPAAFRKRDCAWFAEVADMYPARLIGSRAVALMGIRTHLWSAAFSDGTALFRHRGRGEFPAAPISFLLAHFA
jgi:hypothetical protein